MLPTPVSAMPAPAAAWSPLPVAPIQPGPGGLGGQPGATTEQGPVLIERLLARAQDVEDASTQKLTTHLDQLDSGRMSTSDMLRLQADMGAFSMQVQMTVRVADETGRAIQTLSQRS